MAEWLNAAVLKTVKDASPSGVRIPVSPQIKNKPFENIMFLKVFIFKLTIVLVYSKEDKLNIAPFEKPYHYKKFFPVFCNNFSFALNQLCR
jgi:hypothetical protein